MNEHREGAVYLYCLAKSDLLPAVDGIGVDGRNALFLHRSEGIAAVLSVVHLDEFFGPRAESSMKDISWVGPRAVLHETVVEQVMRHSPVLPAGFGTVFSSLEGPRNLMKTHRDTICRFLEWAAGKEEWALKALVDRRKAKDELVSEGLRREVRYLNSLFPGKRYFEERRIRNEAEKELDGHLQEVCQKILSELKSSTFDARERKVLPVSADGMETAANWALLVPRAEVSALQARIDRANVDCAKKGLVFQMSGPWPPYSFCPSLGSEGS